MSADNWAQCPRCLEKIEADFAEAEEALIDLYGKIPKDDYDARLEALEENEAPDDETARTFREDYEFYGAGGGTVMYRYTGRCTECGLFCKFEGEQRFYPTDDLDV